MNALAMEKLSGVAKYSKDMLLYAIEQQSVNLFKCKILSSTWNQESRSHSNIYHQRFKDQLSKCENAC